MTEVQKTRGAQEVHYCACQCTSKCTCRPLAPARSRKSWWLGAKAQAGTHGFRLQVLLNDPQHQRSIHVDVCLTLGFKAWEGVACLMRILKDVLLCVLQAKPVEESAGVKTVWTAISKHRHEHAVSTIYSWETCSLHCMQMTQTLQCADSLNKLYDAPRACCMPHLLCIVSPGCATLRPLVSQQVHKYRTHRLSDHCFAGWMWLTAAWPETRPSLLSPTAGCAFTQRTLCSMLRIVVKSTNWQAHQVMAASTLASDCTSAVVSHKSTSWQIFSTGQCVRAH